MAVKSKVHDYNNHNRWYQNFFKLQLQLSNLKKYNQKVFVKYDSQFLKHLERNFQHEQGEVILLAY